MTVDECVYLRRYTVSILKIPLQWPMPQSEINSSTPEGPIYFSSVGFHLATPKGRELQGILQYNIQYCCQKCHGLCHIFTQIYRMYSKNSTTVDNATIIHQWLHPWCPIYFSSVGFHPATPKGRELQGILQYIVLLSWIVYIFTQIYRKYFKNSTTVANATAL